MDTRRYFDTFDNATCVMQVMAKKNEFTEDIYIKMNVSSSLTPPGPFNLQFFFQCGVVTFDTIAC